MRVEISHRDEMNCDDGTIRTYDAEDAEDATPVSAGRSSPAAHSVQVLWQLRSGKRIEDVVEHRRQLSGHPELVGWVPGRGGLALVLKRVTGYSSRGRSAQVDRPCRSGGLAAKVRLGEFRTTGSRCPWCVIAGGSSTATKGCIGAEALGWRAKVPRPQSDKGRSRAPSGVEKGGLGPR